MSKLSNAKIHVSHLRRSKHDSIVIGVYKRTKTYEHLGLSTKPVSKDKKHVRQNILLPDIAAPNGKPSYISKRLREDLKKDFEKTIPGWNFSKKDLSTINKTYFAAKKRIQNNPNWSNKFRHKKK